MARKPIWTKAEAEEAVHTIAAAVANAFGVGAPEVINRKDEFPEWESWEWRFESGTIWTGAGPAEMAVDVKATFAHLYFRFKEPKRAAAVGYSEGGRLNTASGKWNRWEAPPADLREFVAGCLADFAKVAQPNPDPAEVSAFETKQAAEAVQWAIWREEFAAECARRNAEGVPTC